MRHVLCAVVVAAISVFGSLSVAQSFPPAGTDTFPSAAAVTVDVEGDNIGPFLLTGPTTVRRSDPRVGGDGRMVIDTEILSMNLVGVHPDVGQIRLVAGSNQVGRASIGQTVAGSTTNVFPAGSFFDVFFKIELPGVTLTNGQAVRIKAFIPHIPPISSTFTNLNVVELFDVTNPNQPVGELIKVWHHPARPGAETKLGLSLHTTNGFLSPVPVDLRVCPTNALPAATVKTKRQPMTAPLLVNEPCHELEVHCDGALVFQALIDRNVRAPDWRGHHGGSSASCVAIRSWPQAAWKVAKASALTANRWTGSARIAPTAAILKADSRARSWWVCSKEPRLKPVTPVSSWMGGAIRLTALHHLLSCPAEHFG